MANRRDTGKRKPRQRIEPKFEDNLSPSPRGEPRNGRGSRKTAGRKSTTRARRNRKGRFLLIRRLTYWSLVLGLWGGIGLAVVIGYYAIKLPSATDWAIPDRPPNVRIVSVDGNLIANRGVTGGEAMRLADISPYIPMAVIAIEDRRFRSHFGIDPLGIARAMITNIMAGGLVQGGSTITQQLAKNLFLEPSRNLERKVQEAILAIWLEQRFTKDEILSLYLNRVYFGSGAYGVDAASRRYFSKSARDVNLAEAALLAGLLKAPSRLSPARDPKAAEARAQVVLGAMQDAGFVTAREVATALSMEAKKAKHFWSGSEHYAADLVMKELGALLPDITSDIVVDTTIDLDLQRAAGRLVREAISDSSDRNVTQGALVSLDGTGAIRTLVGGYEYADSQFNRATDARRQPGSAFKPFVYLTAVEQGRQPETVRVDRAVKIGNWSPENYDGEYLGPVTLSEALSQSINTIAAQLVAEVGVKSVVETAKRLGIRSELNRNASIALGTSEVTLLEMTGAYAPFANGGYYTEPFIIKRIRSLDGSVLYERKPASAPTAISAEAVGMMNQMLKRVVEEGTGRRAAIKGWQVAGKTGTSQNFRDAWFIGYTANLVTGVWYGNDDGSPTKKVTGGSLPAETFSALMETAHKGVPVADLPGFYLPETVSVVPTPRPRGGFATEGNADNLPTVSSGGRETGRGQIAAEIRRRPLSEIGATPRPGAELSPGQQNGDSNNRPRNILEILLGG